MATSVATGCGVMFCPGSGGRRGDGGDPDLDYAFKTKLFWITSRANNCYYCLGHQELKLAAAGVSDDDIAALDGDWVAATARERAAYAFTRKLTHTPQLVTAADIEALKTHFTPAQVSDILVTVAGYNSTNRWTDGLDIPAEASGARFKREDTKTDLTTFKTPTSPRFAAHKTTVAPLNLGRRPPLEPRDKVEAIWAETRSAVLPMGDAKAAAELWPDAPPNWVRFLASLPTSMKGRVAGIKAGMEKGTFGPKLSAEIAWVAARNDRAWYALAVARDRLKNAGLTDAQIFALDGDRKHLPEEEQAALALAETLAVAPGDGRDGGAVPQELQGRAGGRDRPPRVQRGLLRPRDRGRPAALRPVRCASSSLVLRLEFPEGRRPPGR
jgi:alkylhydroperoxidase family enzyme